MSFSNSSIKTYEQCPFKYKLTRIDHLQEPAGEAADRGKRIHAEFENMLNGLGLVTEDMEHWLPYIEELKQHKAMPEFEVGFTRDWQSCDFKDKDVWLRGIFDVFYVDGSTAYIADWKTGKERDYEEQLRLYGVMVLAKYPEVQEVQLEIIYIDLKKRVSYQTMHRGDFEQLKTWVIKRIQKIENDDVFAPHPSFGCKWCHFRKDNGGPCQW